MRENACVYAVAWAFMQLLADRKRLMLADWTDDRQYPVLWMYAQTMDTITVLEIALAPLSSYLPVNGANGGSTFFADLIPAGDLPCKFPKNKG